MKKVIIILTFVFNLIFNQGFSQNIELISYELIPCNKDEMANLHIYQKRIIDKDLKADTLILKLTTVMNCCSGEKAGAFIKNDTLNLISDYADSIPTLNHKGDTIGWQGAEMCDCTCSFTMVYKIKGVVDTSLIVIINDEVIKLLPNKYLPPSFTIYKGDTLFYHDNEGFTYQYSYYESGNLRSVKKQRNPDYIWTNYYESGQVKSELVFYKDIDNSILKEYDENGNFIKYENNLKK
jgi:YD repeat-containing protein